MTTYVTYGLPDEPLQDLLQRLSTALHIELTSHESSYRGVYFRSGSTGGEHFILQPNFLAHEDEWIDDEHQEFPFLLYVNETERQDEIHRLLEGEIPAIVKLKSEDL